jgi:hypothetical protein
MRRGPDTRITVAQVRSLIQKEVDRNWSHDQLQEWAEARRFRPGYWQWPANSNDPFYGTLSDLAKQAGMDPVKLEGLVQISVDTGYDGPSTSGIMRIYFFFDKSDRLIKDFIDSTSMAVPEMDKGDAKNRGERLRGEGRP